MPDGPRVCILNDTSEWYHWGCHGTSLGLSGLIDRALTPRGVATVPIELTYQNSYLPTSLAAARDPRSAIEFLKSWPAGHLLLEATDIVVNGEGTIHGASAAATRLLYITFIGSTFLGKRVHLVNHSVFPPMDKEASLELYRLAYRSAHHVAVRESDSARIVHEVLGSHAQLAFDCLPLTLERTVLEPRTEAAAYAIVTGASGLDDSTLAVLRSGARALSEQDLRLIWLMGAPKSPALDERSQAEMIAQGIGAEIRWAVSFEEWARLIRDAAFVLTGRFHYAIARLCVGGAFAAYGGNTPKIRAMLRDQGLPELMIADPSEATTTIARAAATPMPARLSALAQAAARNFETR